MNNSYNIIKKKNNDYNYNKDLLAQKELSLLGKLNSEQNIKLDLDKYKEVHLELQKINDEIEVQINLIFN